MLQHEKKCHPCDLVTVRKAVAKQYYSVLKNYGVLIFMDIASESHSRFYQKKYLLPLAKKRNLLAQYILLENYEIDSKVLKTWEKEINESKDVDLIKECSKGLLSDFRASENT